MMYFSDKPNPDLRSFVESHLVHRSASSVPEATVRREFAEQIVTTKRSPIFSMHGYHLGKKPHDAVARYIEHYTAPGDLVLDPFCGSGSTALAALITGRKAIAVDASPAATFITRFYLSRCDPHELEAAFERLARNVAGQMEYLYGTVCHRCGGPATIHYLIYSNVYRCPSCGGEVTLFEASRFSPPCCPHCFTGRGETIAIRPNLGTCGLEPVAVNFSCHGSCTPRRAMRSILGNDADLQAFRDIDLPMIAEIESAPVPHPYPRQFMMHVHDPAAPWGDEWRPSRNFRRVSDLFTHRNLWALAACMAAAGTDDDLRAVITSGMLAVSRKAQHLDGGGGYIPGTWALPPMTKQRNVLESLRKIFRKTLTAKRLLAGMLTSQDACISTQSAASLDAIPSGSVDYIFTDPPYGDAVQYAELNFFWEAWLGFATTWHDEEIIVNGTRGRTALQWARRMGQVMGECFRVLKPGGWLTLCYHTASGCSWRQVQDLMEDAGFVPGDADRALTIDTGSATYNQRVSSKWVKRDLVISYRKPLSGTGRLRAQPLRANGSGFERRARMIVARYLSQNPGSPSDRIYDHLISVLIRHDRIEELRFERVLAEVAIESEPGANCWVLKDDAHEGEAH